MNDRNQYRNRNCFGSVILTETETTDLTIFEHFFGEMDFKKVKNFNFCLVFNILMYRVAKSNHYKFIKNILLNLLWFDFATMYLLQYSFGIEFRYRFGFGSVKSLCFGRSLMTKLIIIILLFPDNCLRYTL